MTCPVTVSFLPGNCADLPVSTTATMSAPLRVADRAVGSMPDSSPMPTLAPVVDLTAARRKKAVALIAYAFTARQRRHSVLDSMLSVALRDTLTELSELKADEQTADRMPAAAEWLAEIRRERCHLRRYATWLCERIGTHTHTGRCQTCTGPA